MTDFDFKPKLLIVGRSASGKDTLANTLHDTFGLKPVMSCTTRPPRNDQDESHIFVDDVEADSMIPKAVAVTEINHARYFAMPHQVKKSDYYIIDPKGVKDITTAMPNTPFIIVYVMADEEKRLAAARSRAKEYDSNESIVEREESENERFTQFESYLLNGRSPAIEDMSDLPANVIGVSIVTNDYDWLTMETIATEVYASFKLASDVCTWTENVMDAMNEEPDFDSISGIQFNPTTPLAETIGSILAVPDMFYHIVQANALAEAVKHVKSHA